MVEHPRDRFTFCKDGSLGLTTFLYPEKAAAAASLNHWEKSMSSSSSCTTEERARAIAYAEAECDRIQPRCREAYRATIVAKRLAEIAVEKRSQEAFAARLIDSESALQRIPVATASTSVDDYDGWIADPDERRAARERGLLLARMEREQGVDASW